MGGGYRNDPNASNSNLPACLLILTWSQWGNAMVIVPLQLYQYYGDIRILQVKYPIMVDYMNYLINRAAGNPYLNDGGLGDWEGLGKSRALSGYILLSHADFSQTQRLPRGPQAHSGTSNARQLWQKSSPSLETKRKLPSTGLWPPTSPRVSTPCGTTRQTSHTTV